jgi:hypothetical protein
MYIFALGNAVLLLAQLKNSFLTTRLFTPSQKWVLDTTAETNDVLENKKRQLFFGLCRLCFSSCPFEPKVNDDTFLPAFDTFLSTHNVSPFL